MYKMVGCVQNELNSMRDGLHDVVPLELLSGLAAEVGGPVMCLSKNHTILHNEIISSRSTFFSIAYKHIAHCEFTVMLTIF